MSRFRFCRTGALLVVAAAALPAQSPDSALSAFAAEIARGDYGFVDAMVVLQHGRVIFDRAFPREYANAYVHCPASVPEFDYCNPAWHPYYRGEPPLHTMQSVTKSVTSTLVGIALARGDLQSLDEPILRWFDTTRVAHLDDRKRHLTLRHLLTMSAGFDWNEGGDYTDTLNSTAVMEQSDDWPAFVIDRPMAAEPGSSWQYNSGASALIAYVFRRATGYDLVDYAREHLFTPLGITSFYWKRTPQGLPDSEGGLYLSAEDFARYGQLYLQHGRWSGTQVVPEGWVLESMQPAQTTPYDAVSGGRVRYGYLWWLVPRDSAGTEMMWHARGFGGQHLYVVPERDLVVAFTAWNIRDRKVMRLGAGVDRVLAALAPETR